MIQLDSNIESMIDSLKTINAEFTVETTNKTKILSYNNQKFMFKRSKTQSFKIKHLGYMAKIRKEVKARLKDNPIKKLPNQNYYETRQFKAMEDGEYITFKDCLEVDINKAYYQALKNMNLISDETFNTFIKLPKEIRLALVGSLATRKNVYFYKDGELKDHQIKVDEELREVFFCCVDMVDQALKGFKFLQKDNFLFYWVDGIYLKNNPEIKRHLDIIKARFKFDFSIDECQKIIFLKCSDSETKIAVKQEQKKQELKIFTIENIFKLKD